MHQLRRLQGQLLTKSELPLSDRSLNHALATNQIKQFPAIEQTLFSWQCNRCLTRGRTDFDYIDCKRCDRKHVYCRRCLDSKRMLACDFLYEVLGSKQIYKSIHLRLPKGLRLTDDQAEAAEKLVAALSKQKEEKLVWAVCGSGKTEMLYPLLIEAFQKGLRVCLASPRKDVVIELSTRLQVAFPEITQIALYGGHPNGEPADEQFVYATTHQLIRYKDAFDLIIIDEIDAFPYHQNAFLEKYVKRACKQTTLIVYLTATPRNKQKRAIKQNKLPHVFVSKRFHGHPLPVPQPIFHFSLQKYLQQALLPQAAYRLIHTTLRGKRQLLIFFPTIEMAKKFKETIQVNSSAYIEKKEIETVHSKCPDRIEKVEAFRNKTLKILITTTILERGVTFPAIDVLVVDSGHNVFDEQALVQISGRVGRSINHPNGHVWFLHSGKTQAQKLAKKQIEMMNKRGGFN